MADADEADVASTTDRQTFSLSNAACTAFPTTAMAELAQLQFELELSACNAALGNDHERYGKAKHKKLLNKTRQSTDAAIQEIKKRQRVRAARMVGSVTGRAAMCLQIPLIQCLRVRRKHQVRARARKR